jgi:hypothetical protein
MQVELNRTERALEAILGIQSKLFRPTYAAKADEPESLPLIEEASRLGYATVNAAVDSFDWIFPPPPVSQTYNAVREQVLAGQGNIIVFHDYGKREATLEVLPRVIDDLRAQGFHFVTVHELMHKGRDDVMPKASSSDPLSQSLFSVRQAGFLAFGTLGELLPLLAILASVLGIGRLIFVVNSTLRHRRREAQRHRLSAAPSIAVIVPAFNEAKVICKTVASVLASEWKEFEVLVVDDGSTDSTAEAVRERFAADPRVKVFEKANSGKSSASNFALACTDAEVVICIDADTVLAPGAIPLLVRHFSDPAVGAVAGTAVVGNKVNLLTRFQSLEYCIGQYLDRRAFALFNATGIVPGAIGAWRRKALLGVGG